MPLFAILKTLVLALSCLLVSGQEIDKKEALNSYLLKPGDIVHISVFREDDLEKEVALGTTGEATFRFIGSLKLSGMTVEEARQRITAAYDDGWLVEPEVTLDIKKIADEIVNVMGAVAKPDKYVIPQGEGQGLDLASALAQAGGLSSSADPAKIMVRRGDQQQTYHYASLIRENNPQLVKLIDGDVVEVGINPNLGAIVSVVGEVKTPGPVNYIANLDVQIAIGYRGGLTENASSGGYFIKRNGKKIPASLSTRMQPGDSLYVPINSYVGKFVKVRGEVSRPSSVPFNKSGTMSIEEAILGAGGEKETGDLSKITVLRNGRSTLVNLKAINQGEARMFMVSPGDTVSIPARRW